MNARRTSVVLGLGALLFAGNVLGQENWPTWRGPDRNGIATTTGLPESWSETDGIVWKTALPSWSGSSPIVWQDRIFLTTPSKSANNPAVTGRGRFLDPGGDKLLLLCVSRKDGSILWERELDSGNALGRKGNCASPSPVTDGKHVWAVTERGP